MLEKEEAERDKDKQTYREVPFSVPKGDLLPSPPPPSFSVSTCLQHSRRSKSYFGNHKRKNTHSKQKPASYTGLKSTKAFTSSPPCWCFKIIKRTPRWRMRHLVKILDRQPILQLQVQTRLELTLF